MWPEDHTKVDRLLLQGKRPEVESRKLWEEARENAEQWNTGHLEQSGRKQC